MKNDIPAHIYYAAYDNIIAAAKSGTDINRIITTLNELKNRLLDKEEGFLTDYHFTYQCNKVKIEDIMAHGDGNFITITSHPKSRLSFRNGLRFEVYSNWDLFAGVAFSQTEFYNLLDVYTLMLLVKRCNNVVCREEDRSDYNPITIKECRSTLYESIYKDFALGETAFAGTIYLSNGKRAYNSKNIIPCAVRSIKSLMVSESIAYRRNNNERKPTYKTIAKVISLLTEKEVKEDTIRRTAEMYNMKDLFNVRTKKETPVKGVKIPDELKSIISDYGERNEGKKPTIAEIVDLWNSNHVGKVDIRWMRNKIGYYKLSSLVSFDAHYQHPKVKPLIDFNDNAFTTDSSSQTPKPAEEMKFNGNNLFDEYPTPSATPMVSYEQTSKPAEEMKFNGNNLFDIKDYDTSTLF